MKQKGFGDKWLSWIRGILTSWEYIWGGGNYSSAKAYKHLMGRSQIYLAFKWLWQSKYQAKHLLAPSL
jgi:hypothetical protein